MQALEYLADCADLGLLLQNTTFHRGHYTEFLYLHSLTMKSAGAQNSSLLYPFFVNQSHVSTQKRAAT